MAVDRVDLKLQRLAVRYPQSQLVSFNRGWLEIYRRRGAPARIASIAGGVKALRTSRRIRV